MSAWATLQAMGKGTSVTCETEHNTVQNTKYNNTQRYAAYRIQSTTTALHYTAYRIQSTTTALHYTAYRIQSTTAQRYTAKPTALYRSTRGQPATLCSIQNTKHKSTAHSTTKYNSTGLYSIYNTKYNTAHSAIQHIENKIHQHSQQHYNTEYKVQQHSTI